METRQALWFGQTGQEVEFYPPEWYEGAPSSASYRVFRAYQSNDDTPVLPLVAASIDALSTTVNVASGRDQTNRRRLNLAATGATKIGRPFLVESLLQEREIVHPVRIAATYVDGRRDLKAAYEVGSTAKGLRIFFVIDDDFIQDEANISFVEGADRGGDPHLSVAGGGGDGYRVEWRYTLGGQARRHFGSFEVVRQVNTWTITLEDLAGYVPDIDDSEYRQQRGLGFRPQMERAWKKLGFDVRNRGDYNIHQFRDPDLHELHLLGTVVTIFEAFQKDRPQIAAYAAMWRGRYESELDRAVTALRLKIDQGKEGNVTSEPIRQMFFRR